MGRFETQWLAADMNLLALADLSGQWIDRVHARPMRTSGTSLTSVVSEVLTKFDHCFAGILVPLAPATIRKEHTRRFRR
jgi:hypothetical protein